MGSITDAIHARSSMRRFEEQPVEKEKITELIKAGMAAPTAHNTQPWEFIAVTQAAGLEKIRGLHDYTNYNAAAAIVVCGNPERYCAGEESAFWVQDCSAAIQNIMLAAMDNGLGTVWIGIYPVKGHMQGLRRDFNIPESIEPMGIVLIGYPAKPFRPRDKFNEEYIHWESFK